LAPAPYYMNTDALGRRLDETYGGVIIDSTFERRLKMFDPTLKATFDQSIKRWRILAFNPERQNWTILITATVDGKPNSAPKPLGDWVFTTLLIYRHNYEVKMRNPAGFLDSLNAEAARQQLEIEEKSSDEHKHKLLDDRNEWRRAARELRNFPTSDVTAGYRKIQHQPKGKIYANH